MAITTYDSLWGDLLDALGFSGQRVRSIKLEAGINRVTTATVDVLVDRDRVERFTRIFKERAEPLADTTRPREAGYYWVRRTSGDTRLQVAYWSTRDWILCGVELPMWDANMAFIGERLQEPEAPAVTA